MLKDEKNSKSQKKRPWFYSKWFKESDGGVIMDEAPRTASGKIRKIDSGFLKND